MAGLVPAIHDLFVALRDTDVDARHKAGHDESTIELLYQFHEIFFTGLGASPNTLAAVPPRMLRRPVSVRNGRS
jgi:hypothetical protein